MNHYVYQITFDSGHWYIGKKSSHTNPEDDGYYGSGVVLGKFKKTGIPYFKTIISTHSSSEEAFDAEYQTLGERYITESWVNHKGKCLNLIAGGKSCTSADVTGEKNPFYGKAHTDRTKAIISEANAGRLAGERNPRYGVPCVHTGKFGSNHPMFGRTGEANSNHKKRQYCNLSGQLKMFAIDEVPGGFHPWVGKWGFSDKDLRAQYPKELRGQWSSASPVSSTASLPQKGQMLGAAVSS